MEIPAGHACLHCAFWHTQENDFGEIDLSDMCVNPMFTDDVGMETRGLRTSACLSAYPHGATVRIEAKEGK